MKKKKEKRTIEEKKTRKKNKANEKNKANMKKCHPIRIHQKTMLLKRISNRNSKKIYRDHKKTTESTKY